MRLSAPIFKLKRQARLMARGRNIPLHDALDSVAIAEGFRSWSHLASKMPTGRASDQIIAALNAGDVVLLGGRPGQGKTLLGLEIAASASRMGRRGIFFTLEFNESDVLSHYNALGIDIGELASPPIIDTSNDICASHIVDRLGNTANDVIAVVDYLQILDQKRSHPDLGEQVEILRAHAKKHGSIVVLISQVDRSFELGNKRVPDLNDVRLPNPVDMNLFDKTCFVHEGKLQMADVG
ncbi:DNA helicase [Devosia rhodophyticola]|uniref:DNA helicase n=1 Tax=Devosia rhodophyticola TaxID=3026423 RepID=A0ABY7YXD1_9HYPH|nr:DNA helicase [Devosia rhodophyticola]WDR06021.1 DNA helicase [Devosia rhodophyticola]